MFQQVSAQMAGNMRNRSMIPTDSSRKSLTKHRGTLGILIAQGNLEGMYPSNFPCPTRMSKVFRLRCLQPVGHLQWEAPTYIPRVKKN